MEISFHIALYSGDSYTATGFSLSQQSQPSPGNPFGNPIYPGARQSGGNIYLDIVSSNVLRNQTPIYNSAVGANPVNYSRAQFSQQYIVQGPVKDFRDQQAQFEILNRNKSSLGWNSTNSLFISFFGINDVAVQIYSGRNSASVYEPILRADVADYWGLVERQYRLGARRFLTVLVPPINRAPVFDYGNSSNAADVARAISYWNSQMIAGNQTFAQRFPAARSRIFDHTSTFNQYLDNPRTFGVPNATCFSSPDGQPCLWRDFIHPGIRIQRALGLAIGRIVAAF
ncbi:hypothetical protein CB0940_09067 [Cercospora beticola]|uniref:Uncharacterized protein n=1 Tax=Cercospora beticola TaxID=122368 RepID=A0A2G5HG82_CERBT|nr:hypothetical protein CB0940_09067 [Cercospora beticola]PIA91539.1 hypothetical protein CB0940_09067 [Cercospora beticola]WPB06656.1 hypothetical protein RHO25_011315 [Cercospora beticola]